MSQHNIIGSEAFDKRPFIIVRSYRMGGSRRRRASTTLAYVIVAAIALLIGAVVVALVMGPKLAEAEANRAGLPADNAELTAPAVPGNSASSVPATQATTEAAPAPVVAAPVAPAPAPAKAVARPAPRPRPVVSTPAVRAPAADTGPVSYESLTTAAPQA